jgi:Tol biopolymer transport system component
VPALEGVASNAGNGGAQFSVSSTGTLVYLPGASTGGVNQAPIHWMDRTGKTTPLRATRANWGLPRFSPDGRRLALTIGDGTQQDIWVYEWERDTFSRLTFDSTSEVKAVWTPDGRRIAFASNRSGGTAGGGAGNLYWQRADGTGEIQRLTESPIAQLPDSWHPNGKFLAFHEGLPATNQQNIMILPLEGDEASGWKPGKPMLFLGGPFLKAEPMFSPDGRWLAYVTNESGQLEVYVRPFPGPGGKWLISSGGGNNPRWSRTRRELLYQTLQSGQIMVASYTAEGDSFRADKPRLWSEGRFSGTNPIATYGGYYDLHPDGERVAVMPLAETQAAARQDKLVFVFNFFDELRRIAPTTKR